MEKNKFKKILIANRGEIALRIIRAVHTLGIKALVIHSSSDRELPFVAMADEAYSLGTGNLSETYLNHSKIRQYCQEGRGRCHTSRLRLPG